MDHLDIILIGSVTIIQFSPIKLDPWTRLFEAIGNCINGDIKENLSELKRDFEETKANDMRWHILEFSNSCRSGVKHSKEEWMHVIEQLKQYETYVKEKEIDNGVIEEESKYLRSLYQERCNKNDFL